MPPSQKDMARLWDMLDAARTADMPPVELPCCP